MADPAEAGGGPLEPLRQRWNGLDLTARLGVIGVACLLITALVGLSLSKPKPLQPLMTGLSAKEASEVARRLDELKVKYELGDAGSAILVPSQDLYRLRLELAGSGLPAGPGQGFELFDQIKLHSSDFSERVNYLRALQVELSKTVSSMPEVESSRVHINLPPRAVFLDQQSQPSASVMVALRPGARLDRKQIQGIVHLVASGVEGLTPERVSIVDASGGLITTGADEGFGGEQTGEEEEHSSRLQAKAQEVLNSVLGPDRSRVSVRVELVRDRRRVDKETFEPAADGRGVQKSVRQTEESYVGTVPSWVSQQEQENPAQTPAGLNQPDNRPIPERPRYSQTQSNIDYEISRTTESYQVAPGKVRRITSAVLVDKSAELDAASVQALAQGVKMALGFDAERGDVFDIQVIPFDNYVAWKKQNEDEFAQELKRQEASERMDSYLSGGGAAGALLLTAFLAWFTRRRRTEGVMTEPLPLPEEPEPVSAPETAEVPGLSITLPAAEPELSEMSLEEAMELAKDTARNHPQALARMIETWVLEDQAKVE